jgi:3-hydroxyisobutyrate dehydrogenase
MKIGVAGLGKMGSAIAERLIECGHDLVVWNRSSEKIAPLAAKGARPAQTAAELARAVEAIVTILFDAEAIDGVYRTPDGILAADLSGKLVIDMSTVRPATSAALAKDVRARGGAFVECPVGGSTGPAKQGKLLGMAGGEAADVARAKPILEQLCRRYEHFGPVGAGTRMKLAINLPLIVAYQALAEAFILCRPNGMDPVQVMEFFADTAGAPNVLKTRGR